MSAMTAHLQAGRAAAIRPIVPASRPVARSVRVAARYKVLDDAPSAVVSQPSISIPEPIEAPAMELTWQGQHTTVTPPVVSIPEPIEAPAMEPSISVPEPITTVTAASSQATEVVGAAAADASENAEALAAQAGEAISGLTSSLSSGASGISSSLSGGVSVMTDNVSGLTSSLSSGVSGITDGVGNSLSAASGSASQAVQAATGVVSGTLGQASTALQGATQSLTSAVDTLSSTASGTFGEVQGVVGGVVGEVTVVVGEYTRAASEVLDGATSTASTTWAAVVSDVDGVVQEVEQTLGAARDQVWGAIPMEAQGVLMQAGELASQASQLAGEYPLPVAGLVGAVVVPVAINTYNARFGGYAGELRPEQVLELLGLEEPSLLVDVRTDTVRERDGLLSLKLRARYCAIALPLGVAQEQVKSAESSFLRQVASKENLTLAVHAAFVAGLKQVSSPLTTVVVMDGEGGNLARSIARALRVQGIYSAYVMQGGFSGWESAGLPTTEEGSSEYTVSASDIIGENVEMITEKAGAVVTRLRDPFVALPVGATTALGAASLYNYHTTLEVIGLLGLSWSLYSELSKYRSPQAALAAWGSKASKFTSSVKKLSAPKAPAKSAGQVTADTPPVVVRPGFVAPKYPAPPAAARAEEVLAWAAAESKAKANQSKTPPPVAPATPPRPVVAAAAPPVAAPPVAPPAAPPPPPPVVTATSKDSGSNGNEDSQKEMESASLGEAQAQGRGQDKVVS